MKAILLAAGEGKRLRPYTNDRPKCLVPVYKHPLLEYQLSALHQAGIFDVAIVTGYCAEKLATYGLNQIHNHQYDHTNMVYSLMCADELFDGQDDLIISYTDIVYQPQILKKIVNDRNPFSTVIDLDWLELWSKRFDNPIEDAETLKLNQQGDVIEFGKPPQSIDEIEGQYIGLTKISKRIATRIKDVYRKMDRKQRYDGKPFHSMYMTSFLQYCIDHAGFTLCSVKINGGWFEVDTCQDLEIYESSPAIRDICQLLVPN